MVAHTFYPSSWESLIPTLGGVKTGRDMAGQRESAKSVGDRCSRIQSKDSWRQDPDLFGLRIDS